MIAFFQKITDVLNESNIPYMLSGSVAMSIYIVPRTTRDFDLIYYHHECYATTHKGTAVKNMAFEISCGETETVYGG